MLARQLVCGLSLLALPVMASANIVTFDTAASPLGTVYGSPTHVDGQLLFTEDGINVRAGVFTAGTFNTLNTATIDPAGSPFATRSAGLNNIRFRFQFSSLPFDVTEASFDYQDFGGTSNVGVNGVVVEINDFSALPASIAGVNLTVTATTVTFTGAINGIIVGGQELWIDNIRAVPTPGAMALLGIGGLLAARRRRR